MYMVYVYLRPLPGYCHEMVSPNADGSYTIVINSILCKAQQKEAYDHAMRHISEGHFSDDATADSAERQAHMPL
jgi:hypothetical protein